MPIIILPLTFTAVVSHMLATAATGMDEYKLTLNETGLLYILNSTTYTLPLLMHTFAAVELVHGTDSAKSIIVTKVNI